MIVLASRSLRLAFEAPGGASGLQGVTCTVRKADGTVQQAGIALSESTRAAGIYVGSVTLPEGQFVGEADFGALGKAYVTYDARASVALEGRG